MDTARPHTYRVNPELIFMVNEDGVFIDVIPFNEELLYRRKEEVIGRSIKDVFPPEHVSFFASSMQQCIQTSETIFIEYNLRILSGELRYFQGLFIPLSISVQGKKCALLEVNDITDLRKTEQALKVSEARFKLICDTAYAGIAFCDMNGKMLFANKALELMLGHASEQLLHQNLNHYTYTGDLEDEAILFQEIIDQKRNDYRLEKRCVTATGDVKWVDMTMGVIRDEDDQKPQFFVAVIVDITSRKQQEQDLLQLNEAKDKFFSIISHDLQSPLSSILGLARVLNDKGISLSGEERDQMIGWIHEGTETTRQLLTNLLEWSRKQLGRLEYHPVMTELEPVITKDIALLDNIVRAKKISLHTHNINCMVYTDVNILHTILRNLLNNAIKFSYPNSSIFVDGREEGNDLIISIRDEGTGMNAQQIEELFRIDSRNSLPGTANEKGTGLGLVLCKEFIDLYGGRIWVESLPGAGSTFSFSVPLS